MRIAHQLSLDLAVHKQFAVAEDDRHEVIEVVRDAADEPAHRLQFL